MCCRLSSPPPSSVPSRSWSLFLFYVRCPLTHPSTPIFLFLGLVLVSLGFDPHLYPLHTHTDRIHVYERPRGLCLSESESPHLILYFTGHPFSCKFHFSLQLNKVLLCFCTTFSLCVCPSFDGHLGRFQIPWYYKHYSLDFF